MPDTVREKSLVAPATEGEALRAQVRAKLKRRFDAAAGADGRLTAQQARSAGLGAIADQFGAIDRSGRGAVSFEDVSAIAERLPTQPRVVSLDPSTLGEVIAEVPRLAEAAGAEAAGERLAEEAGARIEAVERAVEGVPRPRVAALEWLDPIYIGGHWVPQMIELAGGEDVLGLPGERSRTAEWAEVEAAAPEVVLAMPCGYYAEQAAAETVRHRERLTRLGARVVAVDAAAYFSRPGPRLIEGIELLGHLLHPDLVPAPTSRRSIEVDLERAALAG